MNGISSKKPHFIINDKDLSDDIRELRFQYQTVDGELQGRISIGPKPNRNTIDDAVFALTGGCAELVFREKTGPRGADNLEYRGLFMLSTHLPTDMDEAVGAFAMDLRGELLVHNGKKQQRLG